MHSIINHNGMLVESEVGSVSALNAGLLHGYGVFTTLRIYDRQPFMFEEHWHRLEENAEAIGLEQIWTRKAVRDGLLELVMANRVVEGRARITLLQAESQFWRNGEPLSWAELLIFTAPIQSRTTEAAITISPYRINSASPLAGIKVIGNLQNILTLKEAEERGFDEAIVLNERGEICEAAAANLFWVRCGILYTPTLATGCLPGITRHLIIDLARQSHIEVTEGAFQTEHILGAEEVFLTSSTRELTRVHCLNYHQFPSGANSIFERLLKAYKQHTISASARSAR
jgi:branched-subunit amino acid aminotransferase/4-amino-4-deoxychorismate lyase